MKKAILVASTTPTGVILFESEEKGIIQHTVITYKGKQKQVDPRVANLYVGNKGYYSPYKSETRKAELQQQKQAVTPIKRSNIVRLFTKVDTLLSL